MLLSKKSQRNLNQEIEATGDITSTVELENQRSYPYSSLVVVSKLSVSKLTQLLLVAPKSGECKTLISLCN